MRSISKRAITLALAMLICLFSLASCKSNSADGETTTKIYTLTFDSKGGTEVAPKQVEHGELAAKPAPPVREGYVFDGWFTETDMEWNFDLQEVKSDMLLTAKWVDVKDQYSYRVTDQITGEQGALITGIIDPEHETIDLPSMIAGYPVVGIDTEALTSVSAEYTVSITVPAGVRYIGDRAFSGVSGVKIIFASSCALTYIGEGAFGGCTALESVPLGEGLTSVPFSAFSGCTSLKSVRIPKSVKVIEENSFTGCTGLLSVVLHSELESVEDMAFDECSALTAVYFYGDAEDVDAMLDEKIIFTNAALLDANWMLYSESEPQSSDGEYDYWYITASGSVRVW